MTDHANAMFRGQYHFITYFYLPYKYIIKGSERGRLMRYFLLLPFAKALLTLGVIETPSAALLILFTRTGKRCTARFFSTSIFTVTVTAIALSANNDLRMATLALIKAT